MSKIRKTLWPLLALSLAIAACGKPETPKSGHDDERKSASRAKPKPKPQKAPAAAPADGADPATPTARFDMTQDGKAMTAGEFDAWMDDQDIRVVNGKAATPTAAASTGAASTGAASTEAKAAAPVRK